MKFSNFAKVLSVLLLGITALIPTALAQEAEATEAKSIVEGKEDYEWIVIQDEEAEVISIDDSEKTITLNFSKVLDLDKSNAMLKTILNEVVTLLRYLDITTSTDTDNLNIKNVEALGSEDLMKLSNELAVRAEVKERKKQTALRVQSFIQAYIEEFPEVVNPPSE